MFMQGTCDTCQKETEVGCHSLHFAAMSVCSCRECLKQGASPLYLIHGNLDCCGGVEGVADWFKESIRSYSDGKYIGWDDIVKTYGPQKLTGGESQDGR